MQKAVILSGAKDLLFFMSGNHGQSGETADPSLRSRMTTCLLCYACRSVEAG
jgi:hypothetical protein